MREHRTLPFYMSYPLPAYYEEEDVMMRDLEYMQQMYPTDAKRYQKKIAGILDKMDYEGSMIYDDFPDQISLYRMAKNITEMIRKEEETPGDDKKNASSEKWEETGKLIQVLLFYEIYKRRHRSDRGILRFF